MGKHHLWRGKHHFWRGNLVFKSLLDRCLKVEEVGRLGLVDGVQTVKNGDGVHGNTEGGISKQEQICH
jgi:hypothetical protein